jgi:hypothetical protein
MRETLNEIMTEYIMLENEIIDMGGEITEEMEERLSDSEDKLDDKLDNYENFIRHLKWQTEYLKAQEKHYADRRKTMETSIKNLRDRLIYYMEYNKVDKHKTKNFNFSLGESTSWSVDEELLSDKDIENMCERNYATMVFKPHISVIKAEHKYTPEEELPSYIKLSTKKSIRIR